MTDLPIQTLLPRGIIFSISACASYTTLQLASVIPQTLQLARLRCPGREDDDVRHLVFTAQRFAHALLRPGWPESAASDPTEIRFPIY
jgi:hypothetical protein